MPWTNLVQPALGLATLRAELDRHGIASRVYHANLDLLEFVSVKTYDLLADIVGLNEFVFTALLQGDLDADQWERLWKQCEAFASRKCNDDYPTAASLVRLASALRERIIPLYLAKCADRVLAFEPTLVGFTCMFDQTLASVALAKMLRERAPNVLLALGGYAVQHENGAEVLKAFPWIDCIARGDGEPVIEQLAFASVGIGAVEQIDGILARPAVRAGGADGRFAPRWNLHDASAPNFDDWFHDLQRIDREHDVKIDSPFLLLESSRGCWWGQKHHCTFCGIDDATLQYRSKTPDQVFDEITTLRKKHGDAIGLRFADYIWPHEFYQKLLPRLAAFDPPLTLEAEIKANQKPETLRAFARAGFVGLQPGIESFSTSALRKMDKGVTGTQNVQLLKWGFVNGIEVQYNLLVGFPGDEVDEYAELVRTMPRLYHLTPPTNFSLVAVTRFAPLQAVPERFGKRNALRHHSFYDVLFSRAFLERTGFDLDNYAYNFERYFENDQALRELYFQLRLQVDFWKDQHRRSDVRLVYERTPTGFHFVDTRFGEATEFDIDGVAAALYDACDEAAVSIKGLGERLRCPLGPGQLNDAMVLLDELRVVWIGDDAIFGLAIPAEVATRHTAMKFKSHWTALAR